MIEWENSEKITPEEHLHRIGTLKEKTLHSVLKNYMEPDTTKQEIKYGRFYVDILNENGIIEIQTQGFQNLRKKLDVLLEKNVVTVVYPITYEKFLYWVDVETGEISKKRKSPRKGTYYKAFFELYKIKSYLNHPNLRIHLMLINMDEYRLLNGWSRDKKKGSSRHDRIPTALIDELLLESVDDYTMLVPDSIVESFTVKDYIKATGLTQKMASLALNVLMSVEAVERVGKKGRAYIYQRKV